MRLLKRARIAGALIAILGVCSSTAAYAQAAPKTPQEFAAQYMAAINKKDKAALQKLKLPINVKSDMQEMLDSMLDAEMSSGTQFTKFELNPVDPKMEKAAMGPDGIFYKPNIKPTNVLKITSVTENGSSSMSVPIGSKDGRYYLVSAIPDLAATPPFQFGWQKFSPPQANWSVMMPNEAEPGKAALEMEVGKDGMNDPDLYGVARNTADIKTCQRFYRCGQEGKRVNADDSGETYYVSWTTYEPETLKKWFPDSAKNLDEAVDSLVRQNEGTLSKTDKITYSDGSPGRAVEIKQKDGNLTLARVYWIKDALYQLSVEGKHGSPNKEAAEKFLSSLEVK